MSEKTPKKTDDLICGRNSVEEALKSGRSLNQLFAAGAEGSAGIRRLVSLAKSAGVPVKEVDSRKLDSLCGGKNHQGVAAFCAAHEYADIEDILEIARSKGEAPFLIILDGIEDPHNLGAVIRTAEACGAHGVIIPKRRCAALTDTVSKTSAGAVEYMPVARVSNLSNTIERLKEQNIWIYGLDMDGQDYRQTDFSGGAALVIGSEGRGISRLVREKCDFTVSIPMRGNVNSLNASVAAGIVMYRASDTLKDG